MPPHLNANRAAADTRYSREQLLDLYREQKEAGELSGGLEQLLVGDWTDSLSNGMSSARWSRREENRSEHAHGPEACWERNGSTEPLALFDMTDEEKEVHLSACWNFDKLLIPSSVIPVICQFSVERNAAWRHP